MKVEGRKRREVMDDEFHRIMVRLSTVPWKVVCRIRKSQNPGLGSGRPLRLGVQ